jgi:hypothetical protein
MFFFNSAVWGSDLPQTRYGAGSHPVKKETLKSDGNPAILN